ncbi:MAG TPA: polysaccharide biosynthesis tyrosine autokinase [Reyranellaceae bacterium]|nr:polysaccharide biosynthesis tyrosine autokinase [Reyranellaceae bacterium]
MDIVSPHALLTSGNLALFTGNAVDAPTRTPAVRRLLRMASRWRWVLLGGLLAGALLGIILTLLMTPQYASTVRLEITRETARVVNIDSVERDTSIGDQEFYQTQYGLLQTKALAERVARDLGVVDDRAFFAMFGREGLFDLPRQELTLSANRTRRVEVAGRILLDHVGVAPVRGSRLVDVTAVTPDPALSQRIAAAWSENFIESTLERRFESSNYARRFLERRLGQLRQRLEQSERAAVGFAASQGIITLPSVTNEEGGSSAGDRSLVTDDLSALNAALATATAERIQAQSRLVEAGRPDASTEALQNDAIAQMRHQRAELAAEYAKMMVQFEPGYPPAKALASQVQALDSAIAREEGRIRTLLQQSYRAAAAREQALRSRVGGLKQDLNDLRRRSIQYNIYQRDADTNRELYNALLQRYKEIGVAGGIEKNNVSVVDAPKLPERPIKPNLMINLILSTLAGGIAGFALAGVLAQIDEGISDPAEIEEKLGLPLLGTVPRLKGEEPLEALKDPRSKIVEAYLAMQANLELSTAHGTPRSLAVTSTRPREGKSTTTVALAQSLARARRKVVLVDADMRSPSLHEVFEAPNEMGVSNFLAGVDDLDRLVRATPREGLSLITAGPQPPNAGDLLTGERLPQLIERLQERFDHVIVDCPPVIGLADAPLVAAAVESVIYVVEARSSQAGMVRMALGRLKAAQVNLLGAIVTKFEARRAHLGYGYDYGYGR